MLQPYTHNLSIERSLPKSQVFALNNGAVITISLLFTGEEYQSFQYKVGDKLELPSLDEAVPQYPCRIMDIESIKTKNDTSILLRLTLEKFS